MYPGHCHSYAVWLWSLGLHHSGVAFEVLDLQGGVVSTEHPTLVEVLKQHGDITHDDHENPYVYGHPSCICGWEQGDESDHGPFWRNHIESVWREARTIRTVDQLEALPDRSVVYEKRRDVAWMKDGRASIDRPWWCTGSEIEEPSAEIVLPVLLIHHPDWSVS